MTNKELIKVYRNFCHYLSNKCVDVVVESSLPGEYSSEHSKRMTIDNIDIFNKLKSHFENVEFTIFNKSELEELGCRMWDDNLILTPKWIVVCCKNGTKFTSINNEIGIKGINELDLESRFGATAWGFLLSELRDTRLSNILLEN